MKLVGFIKEYHNIEQAVDFETFANSRAEVKNDFEKIYRYLQQGDLVFGWMTYILDLKTKHPLVPDGYDTDGVWVWPSYFPYFFYTYPLTDIDHEFISYLEQKNYTFQLSADYENRNKAEFEKTVTDLIYGRKNSKVDIG